MLKKLVKMGSMILRILNYNFKVKFPRNQFARNLNLMIRFKMRSKIIKI